MDDHVVGQEAVALGLDIVDVDVPNMLDGFDYLITHARYVATRHRERTLKLAAFVR